MYTVEGAAERLLKRFGQTLPAKKQPRTIVSAEVRLIREFYASTIETMRVVRDRAHGRGAKEPEFPTGTERVRAVLDKLSRTA